MKTRFIPALIMLLAGAIDCIISIYNNYTIDKFLIQLFVVLVIFFFIGCVVKIVLESSFKVMEEENPEEPEEPIPSVKKANLKVQTFVCEGDGITGMNGNAYSVAAANNEVAVGYEDLFPALNAAHKNVNLEF